MKYLLASGWLFAGVMTAHAALFSEIMYDPLGSDTSREWIEIYNDGAGDIDLTSWKLFENNTNHGITAFSGGSKIQSNGYAVIADNPSKFLIDFPNYTGVLYDSAFSLSNTGEQLSLKDNNATVVDSVTYSSTNGGNDDGTTISLISGTWTNSTATPGASNQQAAQVPIGTTGTSTTATTTLSENQGTIRQMSAPSPDIVIYIPSDKTVVAGAKMEFTMSGMTRAGKTIDNLTAHWAFGDGGEGMGTSTNYIYAYPGRYITQVEGTNGFITGAARMIVTVVAPDMKITGFGSSKYGSYIDIANPNRYEIDLSQWKLSINGATYPFPKSTILGAGNTTRLSGLAMGFASTTITNETNIKILFPTLEEVIAYMPPISSPQVLGDATTTMPISIPFISKKPLAQKAIKKTVLSYKVMPTKKAAQVPISIASTTSTPSIEIHYATSSTVKDVRLVNWFKGLFK
jgi:hypothetical protein